MALLSEILQRKWPGAQWTLDDNDYATLDWAPVNSQPKPAESEILAFSTEVDSLIADLRAKERQQNRLLSDEQDHLLKVVEVLVDAVLQLGRAVNQIQTSVKAQALTVPLDSPLNSGPVNTLKNKLLQIRSS